MLAVRAPLAPSSATAIMSAYSPFSDRADSPRPATAAVAKPLTSSGDRASHLIPPSPNPAASPSEAVNPSPSAASSAGTEFTDVDELQENGTETLESTVEGEAEARARQPSAKSPDLKIETRRSQTLAPQRRSDEDEPPQSVIHIPSGFGNFKVSQRPFRSSTASTASTTSESSARPPMEDTRSGSSDSVTSESTIKSPETTEQKIPPKSTGDEPVPPTPIRTSLPFSKDASAMDTPRAQTRQEVEAFESRPKSSLASISESDDLDTADETGDEQERFDDGRSFFRDTEAEIHALKMALAECWTLCNTLANLSHVHRERIFDFAGKAESQRAWKSCWRLCQNLYEGHDDSVIQDVRPTLDLCRDFCQTLFEVRVRDNNEADSVLRVSFELNNHLFNTHDRSLPEAFRERTLDFYVTLCHRLMKQKSRSEREPDKWLRACWSLAENLFSLRQGKREGKKADEELLTSALQACWDLCDLFREGWTTKSPERGTPRPSQTTFTQAFQQAKRTGFAPIVDENGGKLFPETPTTIFEDTVTISPDEAPVPNILVLGADGNTGTITAPASATSTHAPALNANPNTNPNPNVYTVTASAQPTRRRPTNPSSNTAPPITRARWPISSSTSTPASDFSTASFSTSLSAQTVTSPHASSHSEDPNLTLLKLLFVKAAMNTGFQRSSSSADLPNYVRSLHDRAFGSQPWQMSLLSEFKKTVAGDVVAFRNAGQGPGLRASTGDLAKAVGVMVQSAYSYGWLKDLYRSVVGVELGEGLKGGKGGGVVQS